MSQRFLAVDNINRIRAIVYDITIWYGRIAKEIIVSQGLPGSSAITLMNTSSIHLLTLSTFNHSHINNALGFSHLPFVPRSSGYLSTAHHTSGWFTTICGHCKTKLPELAYLGSDCIHRIVAYLLCRKAPDCLIQGHTTSPSFTEPDTNSHPVTCQINYLFCLMSAPVSHGGNAVKQNPNPIIRGMGVLTMMKLRLPLHRDTMLC